MKFLYLAYGEENIYFQTGLSICSVLRFYEAHSIIVYTDHHSVFQPFADIGVSIVHIEQSTLEKRRGVSHYQHRQKIMLLKEVARTLSDQDSLIFLDSDTILMHPLSPLSSGRSFMHMREGIIEQHFEHFFSPLWNYTHDGLPPVGKSLMINSGVIGIHMQERHLLDQVLQVADDFIAQKIPIHTLEQLAFSYILQHQTILQETSFSVLHYRPNKLISKKLGKEITFLLQEIFPSQRTQEAMSKTIKNLEKIRWNPRLCQIFSFNELKEWKKNQE